MAPELHLPALILAPTRSPGKEGRAGPPERRRELNDWDARRANVLGRQPPGASIYGHLIPLAPGGFELKRCRPSRSRGRPQCAAGRPQCAAGRPLTAGAPNPVAGPMSRSQGMGQFQPPAVVVKWRRTGFRLTPCASAAGACGAAARPTAEYTRAAAPRIRPGQQQARVRLSAIQRPAWHQHPEVGGGDHLIAPSGAPSSSPQDRK